MSWVSRRTERALRVGLLALATASCMDQGDLFGPDPEPSDGPLVRLSAASYDLHSGDRVTLRIEDLGDRSGTAELLVLDAHREVVWRSARVAVADTVVGVTITGLTEPLIAGSDLVLTASVEAAGVRVYASDDTAAVLTREHAAVRPVRFYPGEVVALDAGRPQSFTLDPATGRVFFAARDRARIGVLDLTGNREVAGTDVPSGPVSLRFVRGRLGALIADGTELAVFEAGAELTLRERILLPTLRLDVQTLRVAADSAAPAQVDTLDGTVRPYANAFAWGCGEAACLAPVAFAGSEVVGAEAGAGLSVMRRIGVGGSRIEPVVVPGYQAGVLPTDTIPSRVRVFASGRGGVDSLVLDRPDRMSCPTLALGGAAFDVSRDAPAVLYVATPADDGCGDGTRLLRVDNAAADDPRLNPVARRNLLGEDRIGEVAEIRVSPDGQYVLVRASDRVHLFDAELRLRATIEMADPSAVAWMEGDARSEYFAIASPAGVALYDTSRRLQVARVPLGATRENLLVVWRSGSNVFAATGPRDRDGIVTARVPFP
jgi:hypothetical protein